MNLCIRRNLSLIDIQTTNGSELIANVSAYTDFPKHRAQDIILSFSKPNPPATAPSTMKVAYDMVNRFKVQEGFSGGAMLSFTSVKDSYSDANPSHKVKTTSNATEITLASPEAASGDSWIDNDDSLVTVSNSTKTYPVIDLNSDGINEFDLGLGALHMPIGNVTLSWDEGKSIFKTFLPLNGEITVERRLNMSKYNYWLLSEINSRIGEVTGNLLDFKKQKTGYPIDYILNDKDNNKLDDNVAVAGDPFFNIWTELKAVPDLTWPSNFKNWIVYDSKYAPYKSLFDMHMNKVMEAFTKVEAKAQASYKTHNDDLTKLQADKTAKLADIKIEQDKLDISSKKIADLSAEIKKMRDDYSYINKSTDTAAEIKSRQDDITANETKIKDLEDKIKKAEDDIATEKAKATPDATKITAWEDDISKWKLDIKNMKNDIADRDTEIKNLTDYQKLLDDRAAEKIVYNSIDAKLLTLNTDLGVLNTKIAAKQKYVDDFKYQLCLLNGCSSTVFPSTAQTLSIDANESFRDATVGRIKVIYDKGMLAGSNASSMSKPAIIKLVSEPYTDPKNKAPLENFLVFHRIRVITSDMDKFRLNDGSKLTYYTPEITIEGYDLASSRETDHPSIGSLISKKYYDRKNVLSLKVANTAGKYEISQLFSDQKILNKYNSYIPFGSPTQTANLPSSVCPDTDQDPAPYSLEASWSQFEADCVKVSDNKGVVADDASASFKPLSWNKSLTGSTKISWDFATQGSYWTVDNANNPASLYSSSEPMTSSKRDFEFPDEPTFLVRSILHDCVVPNTVEIVTGFYTCQNFIVKPRTKPLRIIGTIIVTTKMNIDLSALEHGIYWSNIYHPTAISVLQNLARPVLKPEFGVAAKCSDVVSTTPIWHPAPALDAIANFYKCSPLSLKAKADPFSWTMVDPDCGIIDDKSNSVTCKNQIRKINVVELYRRSSL